MTKIKATDSIEDTITAMAEGNIGALAAMIELVSRNTVEEDGLGCILLFDRFEIYGTDIYVLWADKCNKDASKLHTILQATHQGLFPLEKLKEMSEDQMREVNLTEEEFDNLKEELKCRRTANGKDSKN